MAAKEAIDHIVILMQENRSFDHMLGYLSLPEGEGGAGRHDVAGLRGRNSDYNTYDGETYRIRRLRDTAAIDVDPPHDHTAAVNQIQGGSGPPDMSGFVADYAGRIAQSGGDHKVGPGDIMGYFTEKETWALGHFAKNFTVCDHWFSSLAGPTQPNRMYALAGRAGSVDNKVSLPTPELWDVKPFFAYLPNDVDARSYSHDISFLRMVDGYQAGVDFIDKVCRFYDRAHAGNLPALSWIDPNFSMSLLEPVDKLTSLGQWLHNQFDHLFGDEEPGCPYSLDIDNSDHPDDDIAHGERLMAAIYNALLKADPRLERTLFIVTYDEHGGFYDHVVPPGWDGAGFSDSYLADHPNVGPRVPTVAVSGRLEQGRPCHTPLDHTALVRMILEKFAPDSLGDAPERVQAAPSLWDVLPWADTAPDTPFRPIHRMNRKPDNALRREVGAAAAKALDEKTPYEKL